MILVAGNVNVQTTVRLDGPLPLDYAKVRYLGGGIADQVGGVGWNVALGIAREGLAVRLATLLGPGPAAAAVLQRVSEEPLLDPLIARVLDATPRSVVLQEPDGRGAILTDLRGGPDQPCPAAFLESLRSGVDLVHATNIGWALDVAVEARRLGIPVTTDVQALADPARDAYNLRFAAQADHILFSGENLAVPPADALACLLAGSPARAAVCTLGADGVLLAERGLPGVLAIAAEPVSGAAASTGAGDAFAAGYAAATARGLAPADAARHAVRAAAGFLRGERG